MCDPFSIGLAIAGTLASSIGQQEAGRASERAQNAERERQKKLTAEQIGYFEDTLARTDEATSEQGQQRATAARDQVLQAAIAPPQEATSYLPGAGSAPAVVATQARKAAAAARQDSSSLARTIAQMGGVGDALNMLGIEQRRNAQRTGVTGGFKAGSAGVLDSELQAAAQQGSGLRGLGGLLTSFGIAGLGSSALGGLSSVSGSGLGAASTGSASPFAGGGAFFSSPLGKIAPPPFAPFG